MLYHLSAKRTLRAVSMINWGAGVDDLKAWHMLRQAIAAPESSGDAARKKLAAEAKAHLAGVQEVFNGDHNFTWPNQPYLGTTTDWGCAGFFDQWQQRMARYAVQLGGREWVE